MNEDFLHFANDVSSATYRGSELFGVDAKQFVNWRWQISHQVQTAEKLFDHLNLSPEEISGFGQTPQLFRTGISPYYTALMKKDNTLASPCPLRLQVFPRVEEMSDPYGKDDPIAEGGQSPVKEVVHIYPDRVAFCVAQICPIYCRYCFRKRRDEESGLHFNRRIIERGIAYIAATPAIKDVLITGGDPFLAHDDALVDLLERLRQIKHVEVLRFGTRTPVALPYRITRNFVNKISKFGPLWLSTHINCTEELSAEAGLALAHLVDGGIPVNNQAVLLRGVNDSPEKMLALCRQLLTLRVRPYYVFHADQISGSQHLRVPIDRGLEIMKSLRGRITGFGIPTYALDTPSGKVPLNHQYILGRDASDLIIEGLNGEIWREKNAYF